MTHKRSQLHRMEERLKHILRDQVAEFASLLEVIISVLVLTGLVISSVPVAREMLSLWQSGSTDAFQTFLGHAFNLVIGIEFIKMLAKHSPGSALEVLSSSYASFCSCLPLGPPCRAASPPRTWPICSIGCVRARRKRPRRKALHDPRPRPSPGAGQRVAKATRSRGNPFLPAAQDRNSFPLVSPGGQH